MKNGTDGIVEFYNKSGKLLYYIVSLDTFNTGLDWDQVYRPEGHDHPPEIPWRLEYWVYKSIEDLYDSEYYGEECNSEVIYMHFLC